HPAHLYFERHKAAGEAQEHQPSLLSLYPRHRATNHESLRLEAFLCRALDVRGLRSVVQLLVIALAPTEDVVLLDTWKTVEAIQVMHPLLQHGKASTHLAGHTIGHQRRLDGGIAHRVLGTVLITCQVMSRLVTKAIHHSSQGECRRQRSFQSARAEQKLPAILPPQPAPERLLRGWRFYIGVIKNRKRPQPGYLPPQRLRQRLSQPHHQSPPVDQGNQPVERTAQRLNRAQRKEQMTSLKGHRSLEDGRLTVIHGFSYDKHNSTCLSVWAPGARQATPPDDHK